MRRLLKGALFRAAPLLAMLLALAGLEGCLRLAGYGHSGEYLRIRDIGGTPHFTEDRGFFRAFFPPNLLPSIQPLAVPVRKEPGTVRVVVLGESAALGIPDPDFGFSRILDRMLRHRYPDLDVQVINVSATAVNSHVLADLVPRLERLEPDLFVVYAGNNEMVGPFGPGTVFAPFLADHRLIRAAIFLSRTRTGQLVQEGWRTLAWKLRPPERWAGLEMFRERAIAPGAPCLGPAYEHYRRNLDRMAAAARGMGAGVIFCTMAANLRDFAPLASLPHLEGSGRDSLDAQDHWLRGQALLREGRDREAAADLAAARDLDALRFRADSRINAAVRVAASSAADATAQAQVQLSDAEDAFQEASPRGIAGRELFYEHVHFTFAGNHLLARTVVPRIDAALLAAGHIAEASSDEPLDEEVCRRELALTGWSRLGMADRIHDLLTKPPFAGRAGGEEEIRRSLDDRQALASFEDPARTPEVLEEYRQAIGLFPEDPALHRGYGDYLQALGHSAEASREYAAALATLPHDARTRQLLARALSVQGQLMEAAEQYRLALAEDPLLPELRNGLGNLLARQGDNRGAIGQYQLALQTQPNLPEIYFNLGRAYAEEEQPREAARAYRQALALDSGFHPAARALETP